MPRTNLPRVKSGDPITAEVVNAFFELADALGIEVDASSGLSRDGDYIRKSGVRGLWVKLTARSGAAYAWVQQLRVGGVWVDGPLSGTTAVNPATEVNGLTTVSVSPTTIVWAWWSSSGELLFSGG